ncbi:MAG: FAD-dependent oxidoreductase [Clostridium sp.]|uniref:FAD-dependent oxidoreductase n=1 Tax=Clostridium sp. TaxID=1506 RepID=UPI00290ADA7D|nr:FAD-dependent oxidoreductase [Clostridium sp.]MDU7337887.1 FAD-dependent oxidoreductase [Clostridium sp.]
MESLWRETTHFQERPALTGDLTVPVAIIGGGLAGILIASLLKEKGIESVVLEANRIGSGQTQNTTAKITSQHHLVYTKLIQNFNEEQAKQYASANQQAIARYKKLITERQIDCEFEERPAYLYTVEKEDRSVLELEAECACKAGIHAQITQQTTLPFEVTAAMKFEGQAQFHPLKFLRAMAESVTVYENTKVLTVEENRVETCRGTVTAEKIVFASHFPFVNVPGYYFMRMYQERSYVLALQNAAKLDGMYLGISERGLSFRNSGEALLLGGGDHRTGENSVGGQYAILRDAAARFYPQSKELTQWSAQDCMTLDSVPYIGQFSSNTPNWYVATGFGKWGMTSSMVSAILLADQIAGVENPFAPVFSPLRFTLTASAKNFLTGMGQAVKGITKQTFSLPNPDTAEAHMLPNGHGGVVIADGKKAGVYKTDGEEMTAVSVKCPHLGCQLEWNPDEKSWDCPCHGSRFDAKGGLLDGPAQTDLEEIPTC